MKIIIYLLISQIFTLAYSDWTSWEKQISTCSRSCVQKVLLIRECQNLDNAACVGEKLESYTRQCSGGQCDENDRQAKNSGSKNQINVFNEGSGYEPKEEREYLPVFGTADSDLLYEGPTETTHSEFKEEIPEYSYFDITGGFPELRGEDIFSDIENTEIEETSESNTEQSKTPGIQDSETVGTAAATSTVTLPTINEQVHKSAGVWDSESQGAENHSKQAHEVTGDNPQAAKSEKDIESSPAFKGMTGGMVILTISVIAIIGVLIYRRRNTPHDEDKEKLTKYESFTSETSESDPKMHSYDNPAYKVDDSG